jgi:hypothetical protein
MTHLIDSPLSSAAHPWFVRRGMTVSGPFPFGALAQEFALGRLAGTTAVSPDGKQWRELASLPTLLDGYATARTLDDWERQRAMARARWADQRKGWERRSACARPGTDRRTGSERRTFATTGRTPVSRRDDDTTADPERDVVRVVLLLLAAIAIGVAVYGSSNPVTVNFHVHPLR